MGYSTQFQGALLFGREPTVKELAKLQEFLGKDIRRIEPGAAYDFYHVDLELCQDFSGVKWNGAEKTYGMVEMVNWLIDKMREDFPDFELVGCLDAQGDEMDDRWRLEMVGGRAVRRDAVLVNDKIKCPNCGWEFEVGEEQE